MDDTIDGLTERAKKHLKQASDYQTKADNATLAAGKALQELKARITDRTNAEGEAWGHSWRKFVQTELKVECSYSHTQRLIGYVESKNPVAALAEYRKQDAANKRERRASQTSENPAQTPADAERKSLRPDVWKEKLSKGQQVPIEEATEKAEESARPAQGALIPFEKALMRTLFAAGNVQEQAEMLLDAWNKVDPKARKLFCKRAGLQQIPAPRKAA
jgi:hypothetical protein